MRERVIDPVRRVLLLGFVVAVAAAVLELRPAQGPSGLSASAEAADDKASAAPTNVTLPRVIGTARHGKRLVAGLGTWSGTRPMRRTLQWLRCAPAGAPCDPVRGATGPGYWVTWRDTGRRIRVRIAAQNEAGRASIRSAPGGRVGERSERARSTPRPRVVAPPRTPKTEPFFADPVGPASFSQWNREGSARAFSLVRSPSGNHAIALTVGPGSGGPNASSELAALWLSAKPWTGANGQDVWYRTSVLFPSDYKATRGEWNIFYEWHNDTATHNDAAGAYSPILRINTWSGRERIELRWMGGVTTSPTTTIAVGPVLERNRWYDFLVHVDWSPDPARGHVDWFLDGKLLFSKNLATLYRRRDGGVSFNSFGLYNYRLHADWVSTIYFDGVRIGPTRASVS